jgi:hypothetical protein
MKKTGSFKRYVSDRQLETLIAMYHLKPAGRYEYTNEAGEPVHVRTANINANEKEYRLGRFMLSRSVHDKLVSAGGHYLFVLYRLNQYDSDFLVKHGMRPASDFEVSGGKIAKIHPRDVFEEVKG